MSFDFHLFQFINGLAGKWWLFDWLGIFLARYLGYVLIIIAVFLFIRERNWRRRIYFFSLTAISVILSRGIVTEVIRFFYHRERPFMSLQIQPLINHDATGSFPSGHAAAYFALAFAIFYFLRRFKGDSGRKLGWWCVAIACLIGLGRIFAGIHWPLDVLGGAAIGWLSVVLIERILPEPKRKEVQPTL